MAVANYHATHGTYPPAFVNGPDGRPWHGWRVLLLPFLEQAALYEDYRFDEPWDGPRNRRLANRIGSIYERSGLDAASAGTTSFVVVTGRQTAWPMARGLNPNEITDALETTILAVEIPDGRVPWMAPVDLEFASMSFNINGGGNPGPGSRLGGARVLTADFMVHTLPDATSPATLRALLTANGGEVLSWPTIAPTKPRPILSAAEGGAGVPTRGRRRRRGRLGRA